MGQSLDRRALAEERTAERPPVQNDVGRRILQSRLLVPLSVAVGVVVLFLMFRRLSLTGLLNSDDTYLLLEANAILHGNILLTGWTIPDDTFQTSLVPMYVVGVAARGVSNSLVHTAGALIYALLVPVSCLLARGRVRSPGGWLRMLVTFGLLCAPAAFGVVTLLEGSFHTATTLFLFAGFLALDRGGRLGRIPSVVVFGVLLALAAEGDPLTLYIGTVAVSAVCIARLLLAQPAEWRCDLEILIAAVLAFVAGAGLRQLPMLAGGYQLTAPVNVTLASLEDVPRNVQLALQGWLQLFGADFFGRPVRASSAVPLLRAVGYGFVLVSLIATITRWCRGRELDRINQLLVAVVVVNVASVVLSNASVNLFSTRYLVPATCAGAVLAGRVGVDLLANRRLRAVAAVVACVYVGLLFAGLRTPPSAQPEAELAAWLARNHLRYGLGSYWTSSIVTTTSGDAVRVRAVVPVQGQLQPLHHANDAASYDPNVPGNDARFVVIDPQTDPSVTPRTASAAFGPPAESHRVGRYTVLIWRENVLRDFHDPGAGHGS